MISKIRKPQPKVPVARVAPAQRRTATQVKPLRQAVSRFESAHAPAKTTGLDARRSTVRRELTKNLWNLRSNLRAKKGAEALGHARDLATRLGVALSGKANTAHRVLTLVGKQVIHPSFTFRGFPDFHPIRAAAYHQCMGGRINDPDPSGRVRLG